MQGRSVSLRWVLLAWVGITALIALNRGVDLLWGVTILLLVATLLAFVLPALQVRAVQISRVGFPKTAVVGEPVTIRYNVNATGWMRKHGLEIHDSLAGEGALTPTAYLRDAGRDSLHSFRWTPRVRGCWRLHELRIQSSFPLGLATAGRTIKTKPHELVVYPDFARLHRLPVRNDAHPRFEHFISTRRGGRDEFFGLKPYVAGDDVRAVHWRASARLNEIAVKEFEFQQDRQLWMLLDLAQSQHAGQAETSTLESMVRIAHSIAVKAVEEGVPVGIVYRIADTLLKVPASADAATYHRIRDVLARVQAHAQLPLFRWAQRFREQLPTGGTWVMFNLGGARERALLDRIARRRSAASVFVEFDRDSFASGAPSEARGVRTQASANYIVSTVSLQSDLRELFRP